MVALVTLYARGADVAATRSALQVAALVYVFFRRSASRVKTGQLLLQCQERQMRVLPVRLGAQSRSSASAIQSLS